MIARQGRFVEFGVFGKETSVDWTIISDAKGSGFMNSTTHSIVIKSIIIELTIQGGHCSPNTYPIAISMIEKNQVPVEVHMHTQTYCNYTVRGPIPGQFQYPDSHSSHQLCLPVLHSSLVQHRQK